MSLSLRADRALVDVFVLAAAGVILLLPSIIQGAPPGSDYPFHIVWVDAFTSTQRLYPRWLGMLWYGAGGADFFFYPPLAYWIAGVVRGGCECGPSTLIVAVGLVALISSGLGFRTLGLRFTNHRGAAFVAALFYMALPYHLSVDWYQRLALAEFTALAVVPWHLAIFIDCLRGQKRGPQLALLSGLLAFAHLPTAVIVVFIAGVLCLTVERAPGWKPFGTVATAGGLGLGLAAIYWYPAVSLMDSVRNDLLFEIELVISNWLVPPFLERTPHLEHKFNALAGLSVAVLVIVLVAPHKSSVRASVVGLLGLTWFMVTPLSWPLWETTLVQIQFPWRFLLVADLAVGLAVLMAVESLRVRSAACLLVIALISALGYPRGSRELMEFPGAFEWLPEESTDFVSFRNIRGVVESAKAKARGPSVRLEGDGTIQILDVGPRRIEFSADLSAPSRIVAHRTYWRFWRLENLDTGEEIALAPTARFPLISATLPGGVARYRLGLPTLPEERRGQLVSAVVLFMLIGYSMPRWLGRAYARES